MLEFQHQCQRQHQKSNGFWTDPKASTLVSILTLSVSTSISFVFDVVERFPSKTKCLSACQHCTLLDMFVTAGDESLLDFINSYTPEHFAAMIYFFFQVYRGSLNP